jgi:uncharacterized protein (DUF2141 family)
MRHAFVLAAAIASVAWPPNVAAQAPLASISGTVVSTDAQPQPITRAIVMLTGGGIPDNLSAVTDASGAFRFQNLSPGRYAITVTKPAYLPMSFGATRTQSAWDW